MNRCEKLTLTCEFGIVVSKYTTGNHQRVAVSGADLLQLRSNKELSSQRAIAPLRVCFLLFPNAA
jgi:hypothetical protein